MSHFDSDDEKENAQALLQSKEYQQLVKDTYKHFKLLTERGIGFEDVIAILASKGYLAIIDHPNPQKYPNQQIYVIEVERYVYLVPFEKQGHKVIFKTIYPSRKMTRLYQEKLAGGKQK